jgi:hypothetical protein
MLGFSTVKIDNKVPTTGRQAKVTTQVANQDVLGIEDVETNLFEDVKIKYIT